MNCTLPPRFAHCAMGAFRLSSLRRMRRLEHCTLSHTFVIRQGMRCSNPVRQHSALPNQGAVYSCPSIILRANGTSTANAATIPSTDLRALFVAAAVPMVGFGFMDQFVLIQAGGYIDATLGVRLGLATLSAAAAGMFLVGG
jgi:Transmembrane protein 65